MYKIFVDNAHILMYSLKKVKKFTKIPYIQQNVKIFLCEIPITKSKLCTGVKKLILYCGSNL